MKTHILILAGGSGTRLWPLSREELPKQFLQVLSEPQSLLQATAQRCAAFVNNGGMLNIVAAPRWTQLIQRQLFESGFSPCIIEEPCARNTAPAIALAAARLLRSGAASPDDAILICPSDQLIHESGVFEQAVKTALHAAEKGCIVTFGVVPTKPETGYGYIKTEKNAKTKEALPVQCFIEKPALEAAKQYCASGEYFWNAGIFCGTLETFKSAFCEHFNAAAPLFEELDSDKEAALFESLPSVSIDYAVMEKAAGIVCVPLAARWSDVGSWDAVWEHSEHDENKNAVQGDVVLYESSGCYVKSENRLVACAGLQDTLVVDTPDALFIAPRGASQKLRALTAEIGKMHHEELSEAPRDKRPWGSYEILAKGPHYKVKRIIVQPGKQLSLQYHLHRSEHWVIVHGTARVECRPQGSTSTESRFFHQGESVFIPISFLHRLGNEGKIPCEIIEVQIGSYLGEDDIVRVSDDFIS